MSKQTNEQNENGGVGPCNHATKVTGQCVKCGEYPYDNAADKRPRVGLCERCDEPIYASMRFCQDCIEEMAYNEEQANPSDGLGY
jgi:hypothetical protein